MIAALLFGSVLLSAPAGTVPEETDLGAYTAAESKVGRDASAHLGLALWCEAHGLEPERLKQLALAVLNDPTNASARGMLGLVAYHGRWLRPEAVSAKVAADDELAAKLAEYNTRRAGLSETADDHWKLALWCEQNGLAAEARAHFAAVTRLDPAREAAWKRLGCKKHNGRWMSGSQIAAEREQAEAQKQADRRWKPLLTKWRVGLADRDKRAEAEQALASLTDPLAVPSVWAVFAEGSEKDQTRAVQLLGQIDAPRASLALANLAVRGDSAEVRRRATESLRGRDTREFLGSVISLLRKRIKYEVRPVGGPGSPGALFVEGRRFNVQRLYAPPPLPNIPLFPGEPITFDQYGLPVISRYLGTTTETRQVSHTESRVLGPAPAAAVARVEQKGLNPRRFTARPAESTTTKETTTTPVDHTIQIPIGQLIRQYQTAALVAQQQQLNDIKAIEDYNAVIGRLNDRATRVLREVTDQDLGEDPKSWTAWWVDQLGYAYKSPQSQPVPTLLENVPLAYLPPGVPTQRVNQAGPSTTTTSVSTSFSPGGITHNCFAAGTHVRTREGPRPIETIQVGDQVLTQDTTTGALSYQPVEVVFHNRPAATLRIDLDGESIVATTIHRFWKAGQGWVMARDLKPGDTLRTLGGSARVVAVEGDQVQPVFNLKVAEGSSFFVGQAGTLAHDNSLVEPVTSPFDAAPSLASVVAKAE